MLVGTRQETHISVPFVANYSRDLWDVTIFIGTQNDKLVGITFGIEIENVTTEKSEVEFTSSWTHWFKWVIVIVKLIENDAKLCAFWLQSVGAEEIWEV